MPQGTYRHGLTQVSPQTFAYLQPAGGWGWSNSGLIVGKHDALLVDTLFDLRLTQRMLDDMQAILPGPIRRLVNTHHNGDHCYGNELLPEAEIIAHRACRDEMLKVPPGVIVSLMHAFGDTLAGRYARECFQAFDFRDITLTPPTTVFDDTLTVYVDDTPVELHCILVRPIPAAILLSIIRPKAWCSRAICCSTNARRSSGRAPVPSGSKPWTSSSTLMSNMSPGMGRWPRKWRAAAKRVPRLCVGAGP